LELRLTSAAADVLAGVCEEDTDSKTAFVVRAGLMLVCDITTYISSKLALDFREKLASTEGDLDQCQNL